MNNAALARQLELDLIVNARVEVGQPSRDAPPVRQSTYQPSQRIIPSPPRAAARGVLHRLWLRLFGPPAIDPRSATTDFGAFRALYEIGADHLPSSGTWPSAQP